LIRLARDKRGLDTLYLMHPRPDARGETRLRVIYFCTSPQGLSFGRHCLDAARQRALQEQYPDIHFDWAALLQEITQRSLPPPIEPVRRSAARGPVPKADRRPPPSEQPADGQQQRRKRRRTGTSGTAPVATDTSPGHVATPTQREPGPSAPIIE